MLKTIWYMWKPGDERTYAMTVQPNEHWAEVQKRDGFHIVSFEVDIPDSTAMAKLGTLAVVEPAHIGDVVSAKLG